TDTVTPGNGSPALSVTVPLTATSIWLADKTTSSLAAALFASTSPLTKPMARHWMVIPIRNVLVTTRKRFGTIFFISHWFRWGNLIKLSPGKAYLFNCCLLILANEFRITTKKSIIYSSTTKQE